jgi:RNA polymerase sigma factor (sigma-70 family)
MKEHEQLGEDLIERCLKGDDTAWSELIKRYQGLIYSVPRRRGLGPDDAADVFQRVCILLYQALGTIRNPERLGGWLLTTASRETTRVARRQRREAPAESYTIDNEKQDVHVSREPIDLQPLADEIREELERAQLLRSALVELSERCRVLLEAFLADEALDYKDIARRLGIPIGSIGPTRARCFAKLKALLVARGLTGTA